MAAAPTASPAATRFVPPVWLLSAEQSLLLHAFGNAKPVRVDYIPYPKKIAVIFEFNKVAICGMCSSPNRVLPSPTVHSPAGL